MDAHPTQGVFSPHAWNRLQIHHYPYQDKAVTEDEEMFDAYISDYSESVQLC